jgi:hypothetical protein
MRANVIGAKAGRDLSRHLLTPANYVQRKCNLRASLRAVRSEVHDI